MPYVGQPRLFKLMSMSVGSDETNLDPSGVAVPIWLVQCSLSSCEAGGSIPELGHEVQVAVHTIGDESPIHQPKKVGSHR